MEVSLGDYLSIDYFCISALFLYRIMSFAIGLCSIEEFLYYSVILQRENYFVPGSLNGYHRMHVIHSVFNLMSTSPAPLAEDGGGGPKVGLRVARSLPPPRRSARARAHPARGHIIMSTNFQFRLHHTYLIF